MIPSSFHNILQLFPFSVIINPDGTVVASGSALLRIYPKILPGESVYEHIQIEDFSQDLINSVISRQTSGLLFSKLVNHPIRFRSEIRILDDSLWILLCYPCIHSMDELPHLQINLSDFSAADPVLDLIQVIEIHKQSTNDLLALSKKLQLQRDQQSKLVQEISEKETELKKLAMVANRTHSAVVITCSQGKIEWVNEGFEQMTGYRLTEILHQKPGDILQGPDSDTDVIDRMRSAVRSGKAFTEEILNYTKEKREYWVRIEANPVFNNEGHVSHFIAIQVNVSASKELNRKVEAALSYEQSAVQFRDRLLSMASHELRTPVSTIKLLSELLLRVDSMDPDFLKSKLQSILNQCNLLADVIDEMLGIRELSDNSLDKCGLEIVPAVSFIQNFVQDYQDSNFGCSLAVENTISVSDPVFIRIIPSVIERVLNNVLSNSFKYSKAGSPVIVRLDQRGEELVVSCVDQGIGIPETDLSRITDPFIRGSNVAKLPGTGLGLCIVQQAMKRHGGNLSIESKLGSGTTVCLHFPVCPPEGMSH
jgi:PAS domain S-box-containing protein